MFSLQKWGGVAALGAAATYIYGFTMLMTDMAGTGYGMSDGDPAKMVEYIVSETALMTWWNMVIYVANGFLVALLAIVLAELFKPHTPALASCVKTFGALWATLVVGAGMVANVGNEIVVAQFASDPESAILMWQVFSGVENGLGGGNEIAGSIWALVIAFAIFQSSQLPRALGVFSLVIGVAGLLTVVPMLNDIAGSIFGLGYIAWFIWVGIVMVAKKH